MRLFWSTRSPFVRKVMMVVHELGLAERVETIRVVVHPAAPNGDVIAANPVGKIPTLVLDDGDVLYDSRVICEYLDMVHGDGRLIPPEGPERWRALIWQAMADGMMEISLGWLAERAKPDGVRDDKVVAGYRGRIMGALDRLEQDGDFLGASSPTIGHFAIASELLYLDFRFAADPWRPGRPELSRWLEEMSLRPSVALTAFADVY